jgi:hypothetical protein
MGHDANDIRWWRKDRDQRPQALNLRFHGNTNGPAFDAVEVCRISSWRRGGHSSIFAAILLWSAPLSAGPGIFVSAKAAGLLLLSRNMLAVRSLSLSSSTIKRVLRSRAGSSVMP